VREAHVKELLEYRERLIARLGTAAEEFCTACGGVGEPLAAPPAGGWNAHQLAAHTRDVQQIVYGMRIRRTLEEEGPQFENFDAEEWNPDHYRADEPLESILGELREAVGGCVELLRELPAASWSRTSGHVVYGSGFTLQTWVERALAHIEEHLESVRLLG
jgi:hypothetical protein